MQQETACYLCHSTMVGSAAEPAAQRLANRWAASSGGSVVAWNQRQPLSALGAAHLTDAACSSTVSWVLNRCLWGRLST
jgi:hypothetical protein